jgi:hypothetical protein
MVTKLAGELLQNERQLFQELVVDLRLFTTSPSFSAASISANPNIQSLTSCLRRLTDICCKDSGRTAPTTEELKQAGNIPSQLQAQ